MSQNFYFPDVTLLVTHFNRSSSLERLLEAFEKENCTFKEIIVSDDASQPMHLTKVQALQLHYNFKLVSTPQNKGLANNLNKGQDAVTTTYTLYVQEDFVPTNLFAKNFTLGLGIMNQDLTLDLICFYAYYAYPYLKPYKEGFSEKKYKPWYTDYRKIYAYSDHPHLRRSNFLIKFGRYIEGIKSDKAEYKMCISFIHNKGNALFYNNYKSLFIQENSSEEPSTIKRSNWKRSNNILIMIIRSIYRQIKYNYDLHFSKPVTKVNES